MPNSCANIEHRRCTIAFLVALAVLGLSVGSHAHVRADVVFLGRIVTLDPHRPIAHAVAVRDGRIVAMGSQAEVSAAVGDTVRQVELPGVGLPGFADAHVHPFAFGEQLEELDLRGLQKADIARKVSERVRQLPPGSWIKGRGWDQGFWRPSVFPTAADLDVSAPHNPVVLTRIDGHSVWLNSVALSAAGITKHTAAPQGGEIIRLPDGSPSGVLVDKAVELVAKVEPRPTHADLVRRLNAAIAQYLRWGLTSIHDAGEDLEAIGIYKELLAQHRLPLRVYVMALGTGKTAAAMLNQQPLISVGDHRLSIRSFKVFLDGALGSRGAELLQPYSDAPNERGLELMSDTDFRALVRAAIAHGYQVSAHAIGDRAVRRALDTYEQLAGQDLPKLRFRVEHASVVDDSDLPRFAHLHVIASMQPVFVGEYSRWALDRVGPTRAKAVLRTADVLNSGAILAAGTDFPAADSGNPVITLYSMLTRKGADGTPTDGWHPEQRVDIGTALRAMTWGPAYAAFEENDLGMLTVGRLADLTVLSADPRTTPPDRVKDLVVTMTIVGGKPVYTATPKTQARQQSHSPVRAN